MFRPRRSALYIPGSNERALEKARHLDADVILLDLEDAVAGEAKARARENVVSLLVDSGHFGTREVVVRINHIETDWGMEDLAAIAPLGSDAVLIPKVSSSEDIMIMAKLLRESRVADHTRLWAMIETPNAILNLPSIALKAAEPEVRLDAFVVGTNDLAKETRVQSVPGRLPLLSWISQIILNARAHGLDVLDGVYNDIGDLAGFEAECIQGKIFGMDGKTLIHPSQIEVCNRYFSPSESEVAAAQKVLAAFELPENSDKAAIQLDGKMIELLHCQMARRTVAIAEALEKRT